MTARGFASVPQERLRKHEMLRQARTPVFMRLYDSCLSSLTIFINKKEIVVRVWVPVPYVRRLSDLPFSLRHPRHPVFMRVSAEAVPEALLRRVLYLRQIP